MSCGCGKPKCDGKCGISPAVLQINNNDCTLFHKVEIPAAMGDEATNPPKNGAYRNVLLYYAASGNSYLYSSDGIPTKLTGVVSDYEVLTNKPSINDVVLIGNKTLADLGITSAIDNAVGAEASARTEADNALSDRINSNASSISSVSARVSANTTAINNEKTARENADTALSNRINAVKATADSAVQPDDIDYTVMTDVDVSANSSTSMVELEGSKVNLKTGITSSKQVSLPVASSTEAGVMNSSTFDAVTSNTSNINAILSGAVAITGLSANPTQAQLTTAWQNETGLSTLINRASIYDVTNSKVWTYYTNDTTWHATESASTITINQFTNSSLGTIKGSTNVGQIFAENDGTGSVNGWDSLSSTVTNATNKLSGIQDGAEVNVQSDWEVTDNASDAFIKNKPTIPTRTSQLENDSGFIVNDTHQVCSEGGDITLDGTTLEPLVFNHLAGETSQDGTPTPSAPVPVQTVTGENVVQICGKNLFDGGNADYTAGDAWEGYGNPAYLVIDNGYKFENRYRAIAFEFDNLAVGQQYVVSFDVIGNHSFTAGVGVNVYNGQTGGSSQTYNGSTASQRISFTFTATANNRIAFNSGTTADTVVEITNIQLELGSTATAYEPYQGKSYEVNLGKNLWGGDGIKQGTWNVEGNTSRATLFLPCKVGDTYAFTNPDPTEYKVDFGITTSPIQGSSTQKTETGWKQESTTIYTCGYDGFFFVQASKANNGNFSVADAKAVAFQLEKGSTITSYAAYFTPIELCKIGDYQDYIYKSGDKWYNHKVIKKSVFDQNSGWTKNEYGTNTYNVKTADIFTAVAEIGVLSPQFIAKSYNGRTDAVNNIIFADSNDGMVVAQRGISIRNTTWSDLASFTTWITSNPITAYYVLATPTDTEITNQALITQLEALWEADGVEGQTNIFSIYADGNEQMQISVCQYPSHLPIATTSQLGTVIVGHGLTIEEDGKLDVVVDDALSATSVNPVENRAVYEAIEGLSPYTAGDHIDITDNTISAVDYVHSENPVSITTPGSTVSGSELTDGSVTFDKTATGEFLKLQLTTTDPGEGAALADNTLLGVYQ